jgi:hypothetical protein
MSTLYSKKSKRSTIELNCKCGVKLTKKQKLCDRCTVKSGNKSENYDYWNLDNNNSQSKTEHCKSSWCNTTKIMAKNRDICSDCWIGNKNHNHDSDSD